MSFCGRDNAFMRLQFGTFKAAVLYATFCATVALQTSLVACHHFRIHFECGSTICLPSFGDFQGSP